MTRLKAPLLGGVAAAAMALACSDMTGSADGYLSVRFAPTSAPSLSAAFVRPALWFVESDGSVTDLTQFDFAASGDVVEFEAKFKDGFTKIEID